MGGDGVGGVINVLELKSVEGVYENHWTVNFVISKSYSVCKIFHFKNKAQASTQNPR